MAGLTTNGYIARTAGEWLDFAKTEYNRICADLGVTPPRYDKSEFTTVVLLIAAQMASEIDNAVSTVFDQHDPAQASGVVLRSLASLAGVIVSEGTKSRVTLTVTATNQGDVLLTAGDAKATDGTNTWVLLEDVTIPSGGLATALFEAEEVGAILASAGTINKRASSVLGWDTVTNLAAATPGTFGDTDASIRNKIAKGLGGTGSRSSRSIQNAILRLDGVQKVRIVYNPDFTTKTVSTRVIPVNGVGVWVYPNTITDAVRGQILSVLFAMLGGNTNRSLPTVTTSVTGVVGTVEGADGRPHAEGFWFMSSVLFRVNVDIDANTGYEPGANLASVSDPIRSVVKSYFAGLEPGETVRHDDLLGLIAAVPGVARTTITFSKAGGAFSGADQTVEEASFAELDTAATGEGVVIQQV